MPIPEAPNQFWIHMTDSFDTKKGVVKVRFKVFVSIHWNIGKTELTANRIKFSNILWLENGKGPFNVYGYKGPSTRLVKVGSIHWEASTFSRHKIEKNPGKKKYRNVYTPFIKMIQIYKPLDGHPVTKELQENSTTTGTDRGKWIDI